MVEVKRYKLIFCMWMSSCLSITCRKTFSFALEMSCYHCQKSINYICHYFWALNSIPLTNSLSMYPCHTVCDYCACVITVKPGSVSPSTLFSKIVLNILDPLHFHMNLQDQLVMFLGERKVVGSLTRTVFYNPWNNLWCLL